MLELLGVEHLCGTKKSVRLAIVNKDVQNLQKLEIHRPPSPWDTQDQCVIHIIHITEQESRLAFSRSKNSAEPSAFHIKRSIKEKDTQNWK